MPLTATKQATKNAAGAVSRRVRSVCNKIQGEWGHEEQLRRAATADRMQKRLAAALGIPVTSPAVATAPR